jgi:hypothetical protein
LEAFEMAMRGMGWTAGDGEKRQRLSHELQQLKQMSKSLRTTAMRSFMQRIAAGRLPAKRPDAPAKPSPIAA